MKHLYLFIIFVALFPSTILAQDFDELSADRIASIYDMRALNDKGGFNTYQKQEAFIDEYGVKRYRITTLYENMDINKAYETYIKNSTGNYFENNEKRAYKGTTWPSKLPKENKTLNWKNNVENLSITLKYNYVNPKTVSVTYYNFGSSSRLQPYNKLILEFKQEAKGTYLTITSKAFPVSFDCKKAGNATEKAICTASEKGNFNEDTKLNYLYKALIRASYSYNSDISIQDVKNSQISWVQKRNQCKGDINCIKQSYKTRYNEMAALLNKQYAKDIQGFNNCTPIHGIVWFGMSEDEDYIEFRKCQYKGNIFQTYEALASYKKLDYSVAADTLKQKKDMKVSFDNDGITTSLAFKWKNDILKFTITVDSEYGMASFIYTLKEKNGITDVMMEEYPLP